MPPGPTIAIMAVASCSAAVLIVKTISDAVVRYREQDVRASEVTNSAPSDARLARLELAVESIAVEVERISEGQRFTTRLLNEAAQRSMPRLEGPGQINTPH